MGKSAAKRQAYFNLYSANLAFYRPELSDHFVCPFCWRVFNRGALTIEQSPICLAHLFPEALGGKRVTLACNICDSDLGTKFESQLVEYYKVWAWSEGQVQRRGKISSENANLNVNVHQDKGGFRINAHFSTNDPRAMTRFANDMAMNNASGGVIVRGCDASKAHVAMLHGAYLAMFKLYGYEYLYTGAAIALRNAIKQGLSQMEGAFAFMQVNTFSSDIPLESIALVKVNSEAVCHAVMFQPLGQNRPPVVLLVPGIGKQFEESFAKEHANWREFSLHGFNWGQAEKLLGEEQGKWSGHQLWYDLVSPRSGEDGKPSASAR